MDFTGTFLKGESRVPEILVGNLVPLVFATIFVAARLYCRAFIIRAWWWDDTLLVFAWLSTVALETLSCVGTLYGNGHHITDIPFSYIKSALQTTFGTFITYQLALSFTKLSICLFYLRLFTTRGHRRIVLATIAFIVIYTIPFLFVAIFQCSPVAGAWDILLGAKCINIFPAFYANTACNLFIDIWLIVLVVPRIWGLRMHRRQKIALLAVVTLGWLVIVAGIIRLVKIVGILNTADQLWYSYDVSIWSSLEVSLGLFCVSAPVIKPLIQRWSPKFFSSSSPNNTATGTHLSTTLPVQSRNRGPTRPQPTTWLSDFDSGSESPAGDKAKLPDEEAVQVSPTLWDGEEQTWEKESLPDLDRYPSNVIGLGLSPPPAVRRESDKSDMSRSTTHSRSRFGVHSRVSSRGTSEGRHSGEFGTGVPGLDRRESAGARSIVRSVELVQTVERREEAGEYNGATTEELNEMYHCW